MPAPLSRCPLFSSADSVLASIVYDPSFVPQEKPATDTEQPQDIQRLQERVRQLQLMIISLAEQLISLLEERLRAASTI